eukprot:scaffold72280_cov54-Attheya_sp.AAC.4
MTVAVIDDWTTPYGTDSTRQCRSAARAILPVNLPVERELSLRLLTSYLARIITNFLLKYCTTWYDLANK